MQMKIKQIVVACAVIGGVLAFGSVHTQAAEYPQHPLEEILNDRHDGDVTQIKLAPVDSLGRAVDAHIQITKTELPKDKREQTVTVNPKGFHDYSLATANGSLTKAPLFKRAQLISSQFVSGISNQPGNLITATTQLKQGSLTGINAANQAAMAFYEAKIYEWLTDPGFDYQQRTLDYQVTPIYRGNELVPYKIRLAYTGYGAVNGILGIYLHTGKDMESTAGYFGDFKTHIVYLDNTSPNATINYANGTAKSVFPSEQPGWHTTKTGSYYVYPNMERAHDGFFRIGKALFFFDKNGWQYKNRWINWENHQTYHVNAKGACDNGLIKLGSQTYYFDCNVQVKNRWVQVGKYHYWTNNKGFIAHNFNNIHGQKYYFDKNGRQYRNRWFNVSGATYHADKNGIIARGINKIGGHKYFFLKGSGKQVRNKTGYWISGKKYNISKQGYVH
ncbi:MAG: DNA/RNA non-specific endonuclease [Lactobacillaceae bacterium]|jgi:DNA-entry nuclease|nr:DNA/RNA non-specific endonuclease [Lactobacillaceae bacterium]